MDLCRNKIFEFSMKELYILNYWFEIVRDLKKWFELLLNEIESRKRNILFYVDILYLAIDLSVFEENMNDGKIWEMLDLWK